MGCEFKAKSESDARTIAEGWGTLTWLANAKLTGSELTLGRVVIKAGQSNPRHCHDGCEEVLYLLRGQLHHTFGDESVEMKAGDTLTIPQGVMHNATNTGEVDADMIVAYSSGTRDFRLEKPA